MIAAGDEPGTSTNWVLPASIPPGRAVRRAHAGQGARLAVFPEAFLGFYPKGASFGAAVRMRKPQGRVDFAAYHRAAIALDGPEVATVAQAAAGIGRIGAVICWENYMPLLRMTMYAKGVTLYCAPTADDRDTWLPSMQHIALEGRCFVLSACQHIRRGAYPAEYECALGDEADLVLMRGGSCIIDPLGQVLAGPDFTGETILYANIDPDAVIRGKYDFDVAGHYARPDIFSLAVDENPRPPVTGQ